MRRKPMGNQKQRLSLRPSYVMTERLGETSRVLAVPARSSSNVVAGQVQVAVNLQQPSEALAVPGIELAQPPQGSKTEMTWSSR